MLLFLDGRGCLFQRLWASMRFVITLGMPPPASLFTQLVVVRVNTSTQNPGEEMQVLPRGGREKHLGSG